MTSPAETPWLPSRIVVVGASAGGIPALTTLVGGLRSSFLGTVFVVLHVPPNGRSFLPRILERAGHLPAAHPRDREPIAPGQIYVAPPDRHMIVDQGVIRVTRGPRENGYRPSVDALFRSAAVSYSTRVIGVVLSGALADGAAGLAAVHSRGGVAIVQDPADASVPEMPENALHHVVDALTMTAHEMPRVITALAEEDPPPLRDRSIGEIFSDLEVVEGEPADPEQLGRAPAGLVCPDCGSSLFEIEDDTLRYRCRVGHGWTGDALAGAQGRQLEEALWAALRVLEEQRSVQRRLMNRALAGGRLAAVERIESRQARRDRLASKLRGAISTLGSRSGVTSPDDDVDIDKETVDLDDHEGGEALL